MPALTDMNDVKNRGAKRSSFHRIAPLVLVALCLAPAAPLVAAPALAPVVAQVAGQLPVVPAVPQAAPAPTPPDAAPTQPSVMVHPPIEVLPSP